MYRNNTVSLIPVPYCSILIGIHPFTGTFSYLILQVPYSVSVREFLVCGPTLGQDAALEATHVEEQVGIVLTVHRNKAVLPLDGGHRARQTILDIPEDSSPPVDTEWY